jgi:tetratricopeptide (TPR) repeat protein
MVFANTKRVPELIAQAQTLQRAGRSDEAATIYERILKAAPKDLQSLFGLAAINSAKGENVPAIALLERAAKIAPRESKILVGLGQLYDAVGKDLRALKNYEKAQKLDPHDGGVMMLRGVSLGKLRRYKEAAALFRKIAKGAPNAPGIWQNLGNTLVHLEAYQEAVSAFQMAKKQAPDDANIRYILGRALLLNGEFKASLLEFDAGLERAPHFMRILSCKILSLRHLGEDEAADELEGLEDLVLPAEMRVPPGFSSLDSFNDALQEEITQHPRLEKDVPGRATRNGAKLLDMFTKEPSAVFAGFKIAVRDAFERTLTEMPKRQGHPLPVEILGGGYDMDMWANVMYKGGHELSHNHAGWFSSCYYNVTPNAIDESGDECQGWIEFGGAAYGLPEPPNAPKRRVRPEPGGMLVFPSYVFHRTIPFDSDEIRISTAFDTRPFAWTEGRMG